MTEPRQSGTRRWVWIASVVAVVVAVAAAAVAVVIALRSDGDDQRAAPGGPATTSPSLTVTTPATTTTTSPPSPSPTTPPEQAFGYQPLWPFAGVTEAEDWQEAYREGGHQPWHLDAGLTARQFSQAYLGYTEINRVISERVVGDEAWVAVGFRLPNGDDNTAAVVHLAKIGDGADAPWEVVGTRDTTLSLTTPPYGSAVTSPVTVGGTITGVDENLRVRIWRLSTGLAGESGGVPAGGQHSPWSTSVSFTAPPGSVLTIAVSTGGHVAGVERFAITGVRVGR